MIRHLISFWPQVVIVVGVGVFGFYAGGETGFKIAVVSCGFGGFAQALRPLTDRERRKP